MTLSICLKHPEPYALVVVHLLFTKAPRALYLPADSVELLFTLGASGTGTGTGNLLFTLGASLG